MAVTVEQVGVEARRPITDPAEVAAVQQWLESVAVLIRARYPDPTRQPLPDVVDLVTRTVVAAMVTQRGDGARVTQVQIDDGSVSRTYEPVRELRGLLDGGYELVGIRAYDMFPQTHHVELLAHLKRKDV